MCGHATLALGRFLVDTHDLNVFPARKSLPYTAESGMTTIRLHAPCGVVRVSVPTTADGKQADGTRPARFVSVPSFVSRRDLDLWIAHEDTWDTMKIEQPDRNGGFTIPISVAYGGAFYAIVSARHLALDLNLSELEDLQEAARSIAGKLRVDNQSRYKGELFQHPTETDIGFLYGVIITDKSNDEITSGQETGLCFFAGSQIDRSPTGSGVCARVALAVEVGALKMNEWQTYESLWSKRSEGDGFRGRAVERLENGSVLVEVEGRAFYTGASSFVTPEPSDILGKGFMLSKP
ncbi:hypothetical protein AAF712_002830 [Marasmius tenuissimus]|uniref:trans-L-3-hydroxyproline dehydratase n=1 Tax=Marasmius tenuissimus TaxID=585030 RepID=A0ABR3A8S8_9AGAR